MTIVRYIWLLIGVFGCMIFLAIIAEIMLFHAFDAFIKVPAIKLVIVLDALCVFALLSSIIVNEFKGTHPEEKAFSLLKYALTVSAILAVIVTVVEPSKNSYNNPAAKEHVGWVESAKPSMTRASLLGFAEDR